MDRRVAPIRLVQFSLDVPVTELDEDNRWCNVYEVRRPELCPESIPRNPYGELP